MLKRGDHGARLMTENDARYFAGIVDGEGWIDCRRRIKKCSNGNFYKCSSIHVEIQMNHKKVMVVWSDPNSKISDGLHYMTLYAILDIMKSITKLQRASARPSAKGEASNSKINVKTSKAALCLS